MRSAVTHPGTCVMTAEAIEGPFFIEASPQRRDVREDRRRLPMLLRLRVVDQATCRPIPGAPVALWQADAPGRYSGHDDITRSDQSIQASLTIGVLAPTA